MAESFEQLRARLVEVDDPPVSKRTSPLTEMSAEDARKQTLWASVFALAFGAGTAAFVYYGHWIWGTIVGLLAALMVAAAVGKKSKVAACPHCSSQMTIAVEESTDPRRCEKCLDYSFVQAGALVPMDSNTTAKSPTFESPLFKDTLWPNGCVACGAAPTRLDEATGRSLSAAHLIVARVAVSSGRANGIPYCEAHRDSVHVKVGQDRKVTLLWCSLRMMRRYMRANLQRVAASRARA